LQLRTADELFRPDPDPDGIEPADELHR
jgi:hypothetical protein